MTDLAYILDIVFNNGTPPAALYMGLVKDDNFAGFSPASDTMGSHAGWEEYTDYSEATRPQWVNGSVLGDYPASINNPGNTIFTPTLDNTIIGVFLCTNSTKGGTTGQLFGPYFFEDGNKDAVAGMPFGVGPLTISLKRGSTWVN